jgi:hypothetical protein
VPAARRGRGLANEIALARRDSPARGNRHLGFAKALVHETPHTLRALESGALSEWRATLIVRESACLDLEDRRALDAELCGDPAGVDGMGDARVARQYDFLSQIVNYEDIALEKLSIYLRHLAPVISSEQLHHDIDLSTVDFDYIAQHKQETCRCPTPWPGSSGTPPLSLPDASRPAIACGAESRPQHWPGHRYRSGAPPRVGRLTEHIAQVGDRGGDFGDRRRGKGTEGETGDCGRRFVASEPVEKNGEAGQRDADRRGVARIVVVADRQREVIERGRRVAVVGLLAGQNEGQV